MIKLAGFAVSDVPEGKLLTFSYSEINDQGIIKRNNERESRIVMDDDLKGHITAIQDYINTNFLK
ncbi:hypothetical protein [Clostridium baratii]|uniref:hypothetical protein n=1 Tax=Clostridium baratii TaxID=1561 RepID=UPI003D797FAD